jgi:anaerobic magnesium-protoporphyrin IX monomethyl ester cyclase
MRTLLILSNYHAGGAEIAGNWPAPWVAYIAGALKQAGMSDVHFLDAMANDLSAETIEQKIRDLKPDVVATSAKTPVIYSAENTLKIAKKVNPKIKTVLGGIHGTFMYAQVLHEAPWIDYVIRGEGEVIAQNLWKAIDEGVDERDRHSIRGIAFSEDGKCVATPAEPPIQDLDAIKPNWDILHWPTYIYIPMNTRVAVPSFARGCPFTCSFCSQWKFWRDYRVRDPNKFVDEIEYLTQVHKVGFYILADEEPTINKKKFVQLCQTLIDRKIDVPWGINTRVTDILRDESMLPFYRKAGLFHVSLGTEAASQMGLDRFHKETTIEQNKKAIKLLQKNGMLAEAQFIMGLENETPESIEETYQLCKDWDPDMANWNMYTPWPFSDLFEELGDKVEVRDFSRYNFTTPIMKPDAMDREQVLKQVLRCYGRFYARKTFLKYPFIRDKFKRKYMFGCLKAFAKMTATGRFYDIGRVKMTGEVNLRFDESKVFTKEELVQIKTERPDLAPDTNFGGAMTRKARKAPNNTGGCEAKPASEARPTPVAKI